MSLVRNSTFIIIAIAAAALVSGCDSVEHRSEALVKKPLPELADKTIKPNLVWVNTTSGIGKTDARLRLVVDSDTAVTADYKGRVYAFNRDTGTLKWKVDSKANISGGPALIQDQIVVGTREGKVLSFRASDGVFQWETTLTGGVIAAPAGGNGMIFVNALDGSITALNANDGHQLWRSSLHSPAIMLNRSSRPIVTDNHVIVGFANGKLVALNRLDGSVDWEREIAVPKGRSDIQRMVDISADPVVHQNRLYVVSYQGRLAALELESGTPIWERDMSSYSGIAVAPHALYVSDASGVVWALDHQKGEVLWKQEGLSGRRLSGPAVAGHTLVVGDDDGLLHWMSLQDGKLISRIPATSRGIEATPIVVKNRIYSLGQNGKVMVYSLGG